MGFIKHRPKTVEKTFNVNVHEGSEAKTLDEMKDILEKATPEEIATLHSLFNNPAKRKMAMQMATNYL